jgi:hypothetical protein
MASYRLTTTFAEAVRWLEEKGVVFVVASDDDHLVFESIYIVNLKLFVSICRLGAQFFNYYIKDLQAELAGPGLSYLAKNQKWIAMETASFLKAARNHILGI